MEAKSYLDESLNTLYDGLSHLESMLDETAYSEINTYSLSDNLLTIYEKLIDEYEKTRNTLPIETTEVLNKI